MYIVTSIAHEPKVCDRCRDLGLPHPTIAPGDGCVYMISGGQECLCCPDCWRHLVAEVANSPSEPSDHDAA